MTTDARRAAELKAEFRRRTWVALRTRDYDEYKRQVAERIVASLTVKQRGVLDDLKRGVRYISLCCSRRAGKTNLLAKLIILTLLDAKHNEAAFYVAASLKIGKGLIWRELDKLVTRYQIDWTMKEHLGEIATPAGAAFFILGLNKTKQANMTRGFKGVLFAIDECQDYEHLLSPTLTAVSPGLSDTRGAFIAAGTPGWVEEGTWFEVSQGGHGFTAYNWTVRDNEKYPRDVEEMLREERERLGVDETHPDYQREWLGKWAADASILVCDFLADRNCINELPESYGPHWRHVMGMDYGWDDAIAWCVVAANPYGPERIVLHAQTEERAGPDTAAEITADIVRRFKCTNVVCDPAGGGKPFFEGIFNPRYGKQLGCQIRAADKLGKVDSVKVINADLRTKNMILHMPDAMPLAREIRQIRWKDKARGEVLTSKHIRDDAFDAFRYACVEIAPWAQREATPADVERDAKRFGIGKKTQEEIEMAERNAAAQRTARQKAAGWSWRR